MIYKSKGIISEIAPVSQGTGKNGKAWQRTSVMLDIPGFQGSIQKQVFGAFGDSVDDILAFNVGDEVEISWTMYARFFNNRWYNNVDIVKIAAVKEEAPAAAAPAPAPKPAQRRPARQTESYEPSELDPAANNDLPF